MADASICDAVRTPVGRFGGALSGVRPDDLAPIPFTALMQRNPSVDWAQVDDVILGSANQAGEDNRHIARMAVLLSGLPVDVASEPAAKANGDAACPRRRHGGPRLATTAMWQLQRSGGCFALCTMCVGVGQGIAVILERV